MDGEKHCIAVCVCEPGAALVNFCSAHAPSLNHSKEIGAPVCIRNHQQPFFDPSSTLGKTPAFAALVCRLFGILIIQPQNRVMMRQVTFM